MSREDDEALLERDDLLRSMGREQKAMIDPRVQKLLDALEFYADPDTYFALAFWADPPCGDFMEDFSEDHGDPFYHRPMPGKMARAALDEWERSDD